MAGKKILVVDDEAMVLDAVRLTLAQQEYVIETTTSPLEALARLKTGSFDLVITDLKMIGMSGEQLAQEIKKSVPNLPVILMTGFMPSARPPHVDLVLLKPFSTQELRGAIDRLTAAA